MEQALSISVLAKSAGVTSKTLRYWERIGLLPKATRTHTGYRVFSPDAVHYIDFILKAKSVGLTLSEMKQAVELAHKGHNPCPEVVKWVDAKDRVVEQQIRALRALQRRLRHFRRVCSTSSVMMCGRRNELCCLIEDLPKPKMKGNGNEKTLRAGASLVGYVRGLRRPRVAAVCASGCCPPCPLCK
jgi:DNA-binding transcriptional MerR regulator